MIFIVSESTKKALKRGLKVAGYILVSTVVSEAVVAALREFVDLRADDQLLAGLMNIILVTLAGKVREHLKNDSMIRKAI